MLLAILIPVGLAMAAYLAILTRAVIARKATPNLEAVALGAVVNFFDTLGIGSFATTTAWMKFRKMVPDRLIPPTMIAGLTPPAMVESIVFLILLGGLVNPTLLVGGALATFVGGVIGAPLVARTRVWIVQMTVAAGLVVAGIAFALSNLGLFPAGGTASGLPIGLMIVAIAASFVFGLLANFGVGNYAPTLALLSLMGMDPRYSFPIMATGASLMGAGAGVRHLQIGEIDLKLVIGLAIGGIPAVLVAALIVKSMPIEPLRWLVIIVVVYAAVVMARSAIKGYREHRAEGATAPVTSP